MNTATTTTLWQRLAEPTLVRRSVASVMVAFVLVWAVLLGYNQGLFTLISGIALPGLGAGCKAPVRSKA